MGVRDIDRSASHLYPPFRAILETVHREVEAVTNERYFRRKHDRIAYAETLRTPERQLWLYAQGRTRPGSVVTWTRSPRWHGCGLAADHLWDRNGYQVHEQCWVVLYETAKKHGLANPAWRMGDKGHVQWNPKDTATQRAAVRWVRMGFPPLDGTFRPNPAMPAEAEVWIGPDRIEDAYAYVEGGRCYLWVRSILEELDCTITATRVSQARGVAHVVRTDWVADHAEGGELAGQETLEAEIPLVIKKAGGVDRGFCWVGDLKALGVQVAWDPKRKRVQVTG